MKRVLKILFIAIMLFSFNSCKKDAATNSNDLSVSTWINRNAVSGINIVETITFTSPTAFTDVAVLTGAVDSTVAVSGTYIYSAPTVQFKATNGLTIMTGTINGSNLYAPSASGTAIVTYIRQ